MESLPTNLSEEKKIELLRKAISSEQGWINLAKSIKTSSDPEASKQKCIVWLEKIGNHKQILRPATDSEGNFFEVPVDFSELLVGQLEDYLNKV